MKLVWTRLARQDRRDTREYIAKANPVAALALDEMVAQKARFLIAHPATGRPGRLANTRELVVHPNYLIIYDVSGGSVRILRVLHARHRWPSQD